MVQANAHSEDAHQAQWLQDLSTAIKTGDDQALWRVMARHGDQYQAHSTLAADACRLAYRVSNRTRFCEMFMVPVIQAPGSTPMESPALWRQADQCIEEAIDAWLPPRTRKTLFAGIRPYEWVGMWHLPVLQQHLTSTVPGACRGKVSFTSEQVMLPLEVSRLGFITMVLTSEHGWPQLPPADTLRDQRFKKVVAGALQESQNAPLVLAPDHMRHAVTDGLCLWLRHLAEQVEVTGWTAAPVASTPDVVRIVLSFEHEEVPFTQFSVRKHQIGLEGLDELFVTLADIAHQLDHSADADVAESNCKACT